MYAIRLRSGLRRLLLLPLLTLLLGACAKDIPRYVPLNARPVEATEQAWQPGQFLSIAYHDVEDDDPDQSFVSVRTDQLIEQLAWLHENGYQAVSIDQILAARQGGAPLPERAVLLSFDDGYSSFYTRVFPILKAWNWPAVLAPVGVWVDPPLDQLVDFGGLPVARDKFLTWAQVTEIAASGLVEIAAHTDRSHYGITANPQGTKQPAAAVHAWNPTSGRYETPAEFRARVQVDVIAISDKIRQATGKPPRVWVWPYGEPSGVTLEVVTENGYQMALILDVGLSQLATPMSTTRVMPTNAPALSAFTRNDLIGVERKPLMRVAHIDLDYVYDPDPEQTERNLGALVQRIFDMQINTVFLQAFADPTADGLVRSVYFPNRHLPMRADLFNRVSWQLRNRAGVDDVYAWMPVLAVDLEPSLPRVMTTEAAHAGTHWAVDPTQYLRLSPFDARVRQKIGELYEDLARSAVFNGILFHDDALLGDYEDASPAALAAYRAAGFGSIADIHADPAQMQAWSRFKSQSLTRFTLELAEKVRAIRGPQIRTARNMYAQPILNPDAETWYAQNLDDFLAAYDWVAPMAMPRLENVPPAQEDAWLDTLVDTIASRPGALDKTVFELQAVDWRGHHPGFGPIDTKVIAGWMQRLQRRGARNFGYYPDDYVRDHPSLNGIRPAISVAWFPFGMDEDKKQNRFKESPNEAVWVSPARVAQDSLDSSVTQTENRSNQGEAP